MRRRKKFKKKSYSKSMKKRRKTSRLKRYGSSRGGIRL